MKLFIDSGNIKDIQTLAAIGIIDGVTTNPSLLAKEPGDYRENLKKICEIVKGPVSGEVVARNDSLDTDSALINSDPYGDGWLIEVKLAEADAVESLLSASEYEQQVG